MTANVLHSPKPLSHPPHPTLANASRQLSPQHPSPAISSPPPSCFINTPTHDIRLVPQRSHGYKLPMNHNSQGTTRRWLSITLAAISVSAAATIWITSTFTRASRSSTPTPADDTLRPALDAAYQALAKLDPSLPHDAIYLELARTHLRANQLAAAEIAARSLLDPFDAADIFSEIAAAYRKAGNTNRATYLFSTARGYASKVTSGLPKDQGRAYMIAVIRAADVGALDDARQIIPEMRPNSIHHVGAVRALAAALAKTGNLSGASSLISQLESDDSIAQTHVAIALAQAAANNHPGARQSILNARQSLSQPRPTPFAAVSRRDIAAAQAKIGDLQGALDTAREIPDPFYKGHALAQIAAAQISTADLTAAQKTITEITDAYGKSLALASLAAAQARAGNTSLARETIQIAKSSAASIKSDVFSEQVLDAIVSAQIAAADLSTASTTAANMPTGLLKQPAFARVVTAFATKGDLAAAKSLADTTSPLLARIQLYAHIAVIQAKANDLPGAHATLAQALKIALNDPLPTGGYYQAIGQAYGQLGNTQNLNRFLQSIPENEPALKCWASIGAANGLLSARQPDK